MNRFKGKKTLITGTSAGIGHALVEYFAGEGAEVFAVSRRPAAFQARGVHFLSVDIREVDKITTWLKDEEICPDILVNNAGVICYEKLLDVPESALRDTFAINVFGT
ncbi:MAG: SDR family NAD(P)-dependent oxidoreductase, partial [Fretibacterium sp.]|nr:SDR family NAD(P)-dependent oxidoreductase [Fretibacterium sp.]